ncbi:imelysin family protein [Telluribacter sp.]|jgi:predicted lipoprotein|uniref:imelysin family protein n=1 Tax=Telluribacter sp. TaxID=1978767 RepID=UPI002E10C1B4|nr:imelysin family protein [Telluribacter sp.]
MLRPFSKKTAAIIVLLATLWACGNGGQEPTPGTDTDDRDRKVLLTHLADNIIIPSYDNFKGKFDAMKSASEAFANRPDQTTLTAFRQAWTEAYIEWQKVELFDVGPGEVHTIRYYFNIYPADVQGITNNFANPTADLELPASFARQGFPALDYLLNGVGATDTQVLAYYTTAAEAPARRAYLKRITDRMSTLLTRVVNEWKGGYRDTFVSKTGLDISSSTSNLVNSYIMHYERYIRSGKFGIPSGAMLNGVVAPEKVEAFYKKDLSLTLAKTAHQATVDFFNGKNVRTGENGPSFNTYLTALGAKDSSTGKTLAELINAQFAASKAKMEVLPPNLYDQVRTNNQAVKEVYNEMQKAVRMLKVDMASAMSITITYVDNDGD